MGSASMGPRAVWGGTAVVCCVHDVQKRQTTTEAHVFALGLESGIIFDPKQHKIHKCTCCENLFVDPSDEPMYCHTCRGPFVHAPAGPIPLPGGVVDG